MLVNGVARQFIEMCENSLCSILFHLLVPGGKWLTIISIPVSSASNCNSFFHSRLLALLLPPPSAVISIFFAVSNLLFPISFHQVLIVATAKQAVSWLMPTLTQPSLLAMLYTPYGIALPASLSIKSYTFTCLGLPCGSHSLDHRF